VSAPGVGGPSSIAVRVRYAALAAVTIVVGLAVHLHGRALPPAARDVLGDALWAMMATWIIGAIAPAVRPWRRGAVALAWCFLVEFSQLVHLPALDALRRTLPGHLLLGSGFDPRDLVAYAAGVLTAVLVGSATFVRRDVDLSPPRKPEVE
jgi:uncharacterized protein DUF2809